jgi:DNA ligase (NAD+)
MDGSACAIRYKEGRLILAATRGTGKVGEDATSAVKLIHNVPKRINYNDNLEVRGEVCVNLSDFNKLSGDYANPRNVAAGALKRKEPGNEKHEKVKLTFYAYNVLGSGKKTEHEKFQFLREIGFEHVITKSVQKKDLETSIKEFESKKDSWDFEVDGLIITAGNVEEQEKLGFTRHHPKYAIALKFQGESGQTVLKDLEWSVSRTGQITPVALVKPISLSGANISRVSIHHAGFVKKMNLTKNAIVELSRRGGVIPQCERVIKDGDAPFLIPSKCPVCNAPTRVDGDFLFCTGDSCSASIAGKIEHFVKTLEIDGLGSTIIDQICKCGVKTPSQLFQITEGGLMRNVERMGEKNAVKIVKNIQSKREIPLNVFLRSLGIDELGHHVSEEIAKKYDNIADVMMLKEEDFEKLPKVGNTIAKSVVAGLKKNDTLIRQLLKYITITKKSDSSGPLFGKSFVFTGPMIRMSRDDAQKSVRKLGGETPSGVVKTLSYLVVGGSDRSSSKCKKAEKYNQDGADIKIISESEFVKMIRG